MHLDEERLQRLLHGELSPSEEAMARAHLATCDACRRLLEDARGDEERLFRSFAALDRDPRPVTARDIADRAGAPESKGWPAWLRVAAGLIVAIAIAGGAYAIPGSPLRAWLESLTRPVDDRAGTTRVEPPAGPGATGVSGVAIAPGDRYVILFETGSAGAEVRVALADDSHVRVQAAPGAATFTSSSGYLLIRARDAFAAFDVRIPRAAPWIEIRSGERRVFLKDNTTVTTIARQTAPEEYVLRLAAPDSASP